MRSSLYLLRDYWRQSWWVWLVGGFYCLLMNWQAEPLYLTVTKKTTYCDWLIEATGLPALTLLTFVPWCVALTYFLGPRYLSRWQALVYARQGNDRALKRAILCLLLCISLGVTLFFSLSCGLTAWGRHYSTAWATTHLFVRGSWPLFLLTRLLDLFLMSWLIGLLGVTSFWRWHQSSGSILLQLGFWLCLFLIVKDGLFKWILFFPGLSLAFGNYLINPWAFTSSLWLAFWTLLLGGYFIKARGESF